MSATVSAAGYRDEVDCKVRRSGYTHSYCFDGTWKPSSFIANANCSPSSGEASHPSLWRVEDCRHIKAVPRDEAAPVGQYTRTALPGYRGYIPAKTSETVFGARFAEANNTASDQRDYYEVTAKAGKPAYAESASSVHEAVQGKKGLCEIVRGTDLRHSTNYGNARLTAQQLGLHSGTNLHKDHAVPPALQRSFSVPGVPGYTGAVPGFKAESHVARSRDAAECMGDRREALRNSAVAQSIYGRAIPRYMGYAESRLMCRRSSGGLKNTSEPIVFAGNPIVNDPLYKYQLGYLQAIRVPNAWSLLWSTENKRERVTVALIDSGVDSKHPDLVSNVVKGYNVVDRSTDTHDQTGHGTQMAGILGATINNRFGLAGVMDLVNIMPISRGKSPTFMALIDAVDYVVKNHEKDNIKIILMAGSADSCPVHLIDRLKEADAAGLLVIASSGNQGKDISVDKRYPCALSDNIHGLLCVAATGTSNMQLDYESNYADYVDVAASGENIVTTLNGGEFDHVACTSSAAAITAGVAAMLYSLNPGLTPGDAKNILKGTATMGITDKSGQKHFPFGRINAEEAVKKILSRRTTVLE
ncbi:hypothetical protein FOL47_000985 [Perkinsus chesapeaki]|uniref:subtilisin n=1 Tax=Perkinsus chesapeaki TaxID=330153 RepID=A0A7J6MKM3_PERCH|nr:hypothetical protein FOL47_000985 [Perkinsus chesapeaki]